MIFERFYLTCLSQASYLIADEASRGAAVVDPRRDVDLYVRFARERKVKIEWVLLTHFHADFVAGHLELAEKTGAKIALGRTAKARYAFHPLEDGERIVLGPNVELETLATPGHTPEGVCFAVHDRRRKPKPWAVLTGDTLFIGDVGRPDLAVSRGVSAGALAGSLYDSLRQKLLTLPDATRVYPGHGAGSACGKSLGPEAYSTLGEQRRRNYALQPMSRAAFISRVAKDLPEAPRYFARDAELNRTARATLSRELERLKAVPASRAAALIAAGARALDVRDPAEFALGHARGSLNIGLDGRFAPWVGALLESGKPTLLVAPSGREREAATRLARVGFEGLAGYVRGGFAALARAGAPVECTARLRPEELADELKRRAKPLVLDVRAPSERAQSKIPGSRHIPLEQLEARASELPKNARIVVQCAGGYRSMAGASILRRAGFPDVRDLEGGMAAWQAAKL